ncbi:hypothetical protein [Sphaerisporangium corydalis]|uniref:Uncharacterized protein n=1 Tax=Sphaerisporangium corydalis TaxID=1441875 RepID=A0ABV9E8Y9_9ACTN|nr:hypothetical protein [Sphaerisporangium corydalis]
MLVVLTLRRDPRHPSDDSPVDGKRLLAQLPRQWDKELRQGVGFIAIRIHTEESVTAQIRAQVVDTIANPELSPWRLVSCETLTQRQPRTRRNTPPAIQPFQQHSQWN